MQGETRGVQGPQPQAGDRHRPDRLRGSLWLPASTPDPELPGEVTQLFHYSLITFPAVLTFPVINLFESCARSLQLEYE